MRFFSNIIHVSACTERLEIGCLCHTSKISSAARAEDDGVLPAQEFLLRGGRAEKGCGTTSNCCSLAYASAVLRTSAVVRGAAHCKPRDARYRRSLRCVPVPTRGTAQAHCSASAWLPKSISGDAALSCFVRKHECVAADAAQRRFACLETGCADGVRRPSVLLRKTRVQG